MAPFAQMMMQLPRRRKSSRPKTPPSPQSFRSAHPSPFIKQPDVLDITVPVASPPSRPPLPIPGPVPDAETTNNSQPPPPPADTQQQQSPQNQDPASPESLSSPLHTFSLRPELGELDFSTTGSLSDSLADWFGSSNISLGASTSTSTTKPTSSDPPALPKPSAPFANPAISQSTDSLALPRRFEQSAYSLRPARSNESLVPSIAVESNAPLSSSIGSNPSGMMSATSIAYTIPTPITGHTSIPSNGSFRVGTPQTNGITNASSSQVPSTPVLTATPLTSTISLVTSTPKTATSHSNWPSEKQAGPSRERFNAPLPPLPPGAPSPPQDSPASPRRAPPAPIVIPQPQQSHPHYLFLDEDPEAGSSHQLPNGRPPSYRTIASPKHRPVRDSEFPNDYMMLSPGFTLNVDRGPGYVPLARQDSATLPLNSPLDGGLFGDEPRPSRPQLMRMRSAAAHVESSDAPSTKLLSSEDKAELKRSRSAAPGEASTSSSANMRVLGRRRPSDAVSPDEPEQSSPPLMPPVPSFTRPRQNSAPRRPIPMIPPPLTLETRPSAVSSLPRPSTSDSGASKAAGSSLSSHHSPAQSFSSANSQPNNRSSTEPPLAQYLDIFSPSDATGHSPVSSSIPSPQSGRHSPSSIKFNHPPRPNLSPAEHTRATNSPRSPLQHSDTIPRSPSANSTTSSRSHANKSSSSDMLASMVMFDPDQPQTARQQPREKLMASPILSPAPSPKAMRRRSGTAPSHFPTGRIPLTLNPRTRPPRPSQFPHTPASALVSPSVDFPFDKERAPDVPQPATAHSVMSMLPPPVPPPMSALPALPQVTPPSPPQVSTPTSSVNRATRPPLPIGPRKPSTRPKAIDQSAPRVVTPSRSEAAPSSPRFETIQVPWRGLTIEAAKWTFSSNQLQEIVRRAIRQSAESSSIRLLQPATIDEELPAQMQRLEERKEEIQAKYKAQVKRRKLLIRSLGMYMDGSDITTAGRLMEELSEVTTSCDQLCEELHFVSDQVAQINRLLDGHSASALAMALRKINTSFLRVTGEAVDLRNRVATLEAEKEEGWAVAQAVAQAIEKEGAGSSTDADDSRTPITPGTGGSSWSNRVSAARKTSIRASKASLRSYRSHRSSNASFKYNSALTPSSVLDHGDIPPVPPMPSRAVSTRSGGGGGEVSYHPYANHSGASRPVSMMTDGGGGSPISPGRALAIAQAELLEMLGITPADLKEAKFPSRPVGRGRSYSDANTPAASPPMSPIDAMMPPPSPRPPTVPKLTRSASDHVVAKRRTGANLEVYAAHHVSHVDALYEGIMEDPETLFAILDPHQPRTRF